MDLSSLHIASPYDSSHSRRTSATQATTAPNTALASAKMDQRSDTESTKKSARHAFAYSGSAIREQTLKELGHITNNAFITTMAQCRALPDWQTTEKKVHATVEKLGFARTAPGQYQHTGSKLTPDKALTALMKANKSRPLIFSSASAMQAAALLSLLGNSGGNLFNLYINKTPQGRLEIGESELLPSKTISHYCSRYEIVENKLPDSIEHGDIVCMEGPHDNAVWHPGREANALNLFCVDKSDADAPTRLVGLTSVSHSGDGSLEPGALRQRFLDDYHAPQTLREFALFEQAKDQQDSGPDGHLSPHDAYRMIANDQPDALAGAQALLHKLKQLQQLKAQGKGNESKLDQQIESLLETKTAIMPPATDKIKGAVYHSKPLDFSLQDLLDDRSEAGTIASAIAVAPGEEGVELFPYAASSPVHQQQMFSAAKSFFDRCMNPEFDNKFDGLILHGDADTGIGLGSSVLVERLALQGKHVWCADLAQSKEAAPASSDDASQAYEAAITAKFKPEWQKADVLVIDATGKDDEAFARTSCAMLDYARESGKKVVVTSHQNPFEAFSSHIETPYDSLSIRHIARDAAARSRFPESVWNEVYISTDVETDGPIPGDNSMLSFGAAAYMADKTLVSTFSANLELFPGAEPNPGTMAWWGQPEQQKAWEACRKNQEPPKAAMSRYVNWVNSQPAKKPVFVAYPAGFDFMFMYWYMVKLKLKSPFSFSAMDMRSYASATMGTGYKASGKDQMPPEWKDPLEHDHTGINDAIEQGAIFCNMLAANHDKKRLTDGK